MDQEMGPPAPPQPAPPQRTNAAYLFPERAPAEAPAQAAPVREAALVVDPGMQTVFVPIPNNHCTYYDFVKFLVDKGFSYVSRDNSGVYYSRKLETPAPSDGDMSEID